MPTKDADLVPVTAQAPQNDLWLLPNRILKTRLASGESQTFWIDLAQNEYVEIIVEQLGIDVRLEFLSPDGKQLATFDSPTGNQGSEPAFWIAEVSGEYRLVVHSLYNSLAEGSFYISLREQRPATYRDHELHLAWLAHREAEELTSMVAVARWNEALERYRDSMNHWEKAGCSVLNTVALTRMAHLYLDLGDFDAALRHQRKALEEWSDYAEKNHATDCLLAPWLEPESSLYVAIGEIYNTLADHERALDYFQLALRSNDDPRFRAETLDRLGNCYLALSDPESALPELENALRQWQADRHFAKKAETLLSLARAYELLGKPGVIELYRESIPLFEASTHTRNYIVHAHLETGRVHLSRNEWSLAKDAYHQALEAARRLEVPGWEVGALLAQGDLFLTLKEPAAAYEAYWQVLRLAQNQLAPSLLQQANHGLARWALAEGSLEEARKWSEEALEIADGFWVRSLAPHLKRSILESQLPYFEFHIDLLMRLHAADPGAGFDRLALETHERIRARSLFTLLSRNHHRVSTDGYLQTEEEQHLRRKIDDWYLQRTKRHQVGITIDSKQATAEENQLTDLMSRLHEVEAEARAKDPRWKAHRRPLPLELQDIQQILGSDTLLLKYALGEDRSVLWSITADHFESVELPPRFEIEGAARRVYDLVSAPRRKPVFETKEQKQRRIKRAETDFYDAAVELSRLILEPLAGRLNRRRLVVVSDGVLQYIPFTVLPKPGSDPRSWVNDEFTPLVEDYEVVSAPSVAVLTHLLQKPQHRTASRTLAVVADPIFQADDPRLKPQGHAATLSANSSTQILESTRLVTRSADFLGRSGFSRLPGTREEALAILDLLPPGEGFAALDFEAQRRPELLNGLQDFQILHFATHAILNTKHPELSSIVLSLVDKQHRPLNGMLTLDDVSRLELDTELVVLSACQTALGKEVRGEGLIGLSSGFFQAGAATVVASLWSPQDEATAELMTRFYEAMFARNLAPSRALREAQLSMRREPRWESPYYWGGFIVQGDWRALQELGHGA